MIRFLDIYILWSILVGIYYFYYWNKYEKSELVKNVSKSMFIIIALLVFLLSSILAPLSIIELLNKTKNKEDSKNV